MRFDTTICGIPCQIRVLNYNYEAQPINVSVERSYPSEVVFEYDVLDRKGYLAKWLRTKITPDIEDRIFNEFINIHYPTFGSKMVT